MTRAPLPLLRLLPLCLAALFALAPLAARADEDPNDPNSPLGSGNPCFDASKVADSLSLESSAEDPNDPNAPPIVTGFFSALPDCAKLCDKAGKLCETFAKRAASCETRYADDRFRFNVRTECEGLHGADLKTCSQQFESAHQTRSQRAADKLAAAVSACGTRSADCAGRCNAAP